MNVERTKIRVAHIVCVIPPYGGGIGMAAHQQAEMLTAADYDVTVFTPRVKANKQFERKYKIDQLWSILKIGHGAYMINLLWKLRNFNIIHLHYPFFGASLLCAIAKKISPKKPKFILSYHQDLILKGWRGWYYQVGNKLFLSFILNQADKIIVSSVDYVENSLIRGYYFEHKKKFVFIPFAVSERFKPAPKDKELLDKFSFTENDFVVLFVGGLDSAHYFKGIEYLIKAFKKLHFPLIKALIVGKGNLMKQYQKEVQVLDLDDKIKFAGYVDDENLARYYNLADLFILASININEAFGIVLIEAMACGVPLIASNLKGVRTVVQLGENGFLVTPKDSQDIANKIEWLYNNRKLLNKFSANCLENVKRYRLDQVSQKLLAVYKQLSKW